MAAPGGVQVLGICRFSVPGLGAFQNVPEDLTARRAALYAPARLHTRLVWFEHVFLPAIRQQTDADFTLILLLGQDFPEPWRARMLALVADVPQIRPVFAPPGWHRAVCAEAMRPYVDKSARRVAQFRLDDDDAVAVDFVARLRSDIVLAEPMLARSPAMAFDYGKGFVLRDAGGATPETEPCITHCWTPAMALVLPRRRDRFVLDYPHHIIWRRMPLMSYPDQIMFVRGAHGGNDSRIHVQERGFQIAPGEIAAIFQDRFRIDLAGFGAALNTIPGREYDGS